MICRHYFFKFILAILILLPDGIRSQEITKLENPISVEYLQKNLLKDHPRLVLNSTIEEELKIKIEEDSIIGNMYHAIRANAFEILEEPFLNRELTGRRLLHISREMLYRMNMLGLVYRMEKDSIILDRINRELITVCNFIDWNPSHFLDVAEMSLAVALGFDWTANDLPDTTISVVQKALITKGIKPSYEGDEPQWWIKGTNNWNQVCHAGMVAASIAISDIDLELAAKTISRALAGIPYALSEYGPDGVYPEGSTYWSYGTAFTVLTSAMFESALGTDFGIADYPAFKESVVFRLLSIAPSGWYYNFGDSGDRRSDNGDLVLAWFASKTGNSNYFEADRFLQTPEQMGKLERYAGAALVWLSQFHPLKSITPSNVWMGRGANSVVVFTDSNDSSAGYYFGAKGGCGALSHGNMDAGSFVFELNGVRWVVDPGNQDYHELEKTGFKLWDMCQGCQRWTLLNKNNFGHSTITVNDRLHVVDGNVQIIDFKDEINPEVTFNMKPAFGDQLKSATRRFVKDGKKSLYIEDEIGINALTETVTWQLLTTAEVELTNKGAILKQDGKILNLYVISPPAVSIYVVSLDPPPYPLDRRIEGLKRIELRIYAHSFPEGSGKISVRLFAE